MIGAIVVKELTEYARDRRALAILTLIAALMLVGLLTAWAMHAKHEQQVDSARSRDLQTFLRQGAKPSHSAAHFGRMAHKPPAPLGIFDAGASPYLGQVIWLEAHRQDPAMFRPAADAPELSRLADLSVAGVLTSLLPLLLFVIGAGSFAGERERQTLRQALASGPAPAVLFRGKLLAVAGVGVAVSLLVVAVATSIAIASSAVASASDTILRSVGLFAGLAAYSCICAAVALLVSSRVRTASAALLILLTLWALSVVVAPRVAASAGELLHPTPNSSAFWSQVADSIRAGRPQRGSEELRSIERSIVSRAVGKELTAQEVAAVPVNRAALGQEISEVLGARAHRAAFANLYAIYERQRKVRRWMSIIAPAMALSHWSSALSGTDLTAHRHFALEAERQRQLIVRRLNEDMMLNGAGQGYDYLASADFWRTVPEFVYRPPSIELAVRAALPDGLALLAWSVLAIAAAGLAARRQHAI